MDLSAFIVSVFCLAEDFLGGRKLRSRGPAPKLSDAEVITMEIVGEFLSIDTDKAIHAYFRRHYAEWFPAVAKIHRTTFSRQAANLWKVKEELWRHLLESEFGGRPLGEEGMELCVVDSFPMAVCQKARSHRCRIVGELSDYGRDTVGGGFFYGVRAHVVVAWPGVVVRASLAPANVHDLSVAEELLEGAGAGWVLADRNYWSPDLAERLRRQGAGETRLLSRYKVAKREREKGLRWPRWLVHKRRRIETVFSQLAGRWSAKKVWARDSWHLASRFVRKILGHTVAVHLCRGQGLSPLRFSELLTD